MKKIRKLTAALIMGVMVSSMAASAAPSINNEFINNQQVILDRIQSKIITIQQIAVNIALNIQPSVNVNLNLDNIGPKLD